MSEKTVFIRDVLDPLDEKLIHDLIIRMALKVGEKTEGSLNEKLLNPMALQLLGGYLVGLFQAICEKDGIDVTSVPTADGTGIETGLKVRTRH